MTHDPNTDFDEEFGEHPSTTNNVDMSDVKLQVPAVPQRNFEDD